MNLKRKLFRINNNKDGKVLLQNFTYLSLLQISGYVFPLFTIPYLAKVIGVEGFGKIAFASAVIGWIQTISDWGFNYTATRDVAKKRGDLKIVSDIFSNIFWARLFLMFISFIVLLILIVTIPKFRNESDILLVTFLLVPGYISFPEWLFQALEKMKYITLLTVLSKFIFTISIFVFVRKESDYLLQPILVSLGFIVSGIIAMYIILIKWKIKLNKPSVNCIFNVIKNSTDVFINNLMPNLYNSVSIVLLGFFSGAIQNGKFDAGSKFVNVAQQFLNVISRTFYPFLSRRIEKHNLYAKINICLSILFSLILFFGAPFLIKFFFTKDFYDSIIVLQILSVSIFFLSLSNIYGINYMIIQGNEKELRNITSIMSIFGFLLSIPMIYYFGYIGAAISLVTTRVLLGGITMLKALVIKRRK